MIATPILFISPVRAGKSTIAYLIASQLKFPHISLDELRWGYYNEIGYDDELAKQIRAQGGFLALMFYRQLFDAHSVERVLSEYPEAVIDFGAGIGSFENQEHMEHIHALFGPIPNIFLLLPSPDIEESLMILRQRDVSPPVDLKFDINAHFLHHPGYRLLAKHIIYTNNKIPEQVCAEVVKLLH